MKLTTLLMIGIILFAAFLRMYHLGATPISLNWDEAALGYNAYSILKTGKDEYGTFLPIILRSFGNYTPALYTYLTVPAVALFGLTPFATRLPSAIMGILAVLGTYFLVKKLISLDSYFSLSPNLVAICASFLLAISPWHLQFSRVAYEANIALTLSIWGFYFFLKGLTKPISYLYSAFFYGLALNTYHSTRLFIPLLLSALVIVFRSTLSKQKKWIIFASVVGTIFILPFIYLSIFNQQEQITARFNATSIFHSQEKKINSSSLNKSPLNKLYFSIIPSSLYEIVSGYISHFSLRWLFITGDNDRHHAPSTGLLYIWELPFLLSGLFFIFKNKTSFRTTVLIWLFTVPIPASLTVEVPHAVRTLIWLPLPQLIVSIGILDTFTFIKRKQPFVLVSTIFFFVMVICFSLGEYLELYHKQLNLESSRFWQFGYESAANFVNQRKDTYDKIFVSNKLEQPYIFFLFYLKYDPVLYLKSGGTGSYEHQSFDKFVFGAIDWETKKQSGKYLYVLDPLEAKVTPISRVEHTIRYFDGSESIVIAE